jgi:hypothetical protein
MRDTEIKMADVVRRNQMAWIMFWFLLGVFFLILAALAYSAFTGRGQTWIAFMLLDGIVGWSIKHVVSYLFPPL